MSTQVVELVAVDGTPIEYIDEVIGSGGSKDVYYSPDKSYVVAFFRKTPDANTQARLENIVSRYRKSIFEQEFGDYWRRFFCWPTNIVYHEGRLGVVSPTYDADFFFKVGSKENDRSRLRGKEKNGKWFASAKHQNTILARAERGDWYNYFQVCLCISRAVRRLHAAGLAHSDLSFNNVLVAPTAGRACIIDIDGLVVPGKFFPEVIGTKEFIAPEVYQTKNLPKDDPRRSLPNIRTDRFALAVLVYFYLLNRDPFDGQKVFDIDDDERDEMLRRGEKALFVENPHDISNAVRVSDLDEKQLPQGDPAQRPYTLCGPYLKKLFDRAFITGLHQPDLRPTAQEWEDEIVKTVDLLHPCPNLDCSHKWFVLDDIERRVCPFCGEKVRGAIPVLDLYYLHSNGEYMSEEHWVVLYDGRPLYPWHLQHNIAPNERLPLSERKRVAFFRKQGEKWLLVNERIAELWDLSAGKPISVGAVVELYHGQRLLFSDAPEGRRCVVRWEHEI
ncbi:MAG: helix-hairpin-helix domain-containing protein [Bacteroides sp.]